MEAKELIERYNKGERDFSNADLRAADLCGADLSCADLSDADLRAADLCGADLSCADLSDANLRDANLYGINLYCAKINWKSHQLLSEILLRATNSMMQESLALLIRNNTALCWSEWLADQPPYIAWSEDDWQKIVVDNRQWALSTLAEYAKDDDDAPDAVKALVKKDDAK